MIQQHPLGWGWQWHTCDWAGGLEGKLTAVLAMHVPEVFLVTSLGSDLKQLYKHRFGWEWLVRKPLQQEALLELREGEWIIQWALTESLRPKALQQPFCCQALHEPKPHSQVCALHGDFFILGSGGGSGGRGCLGMAGC